MGRTKALTVVLCLVCAGTYGKVSKKTEQQLKTQRTILREISKHFGQTKLKTDEQTLDYFKGLLGRDYEAKLNALLENPRYQQHLKFGIKDKTLKGQIKNIAESMNSNHREGQASKRQIDLEVINILSLLPRISGKDETSQSLVHLFDLYTNTPSAFRDLPKFRELISSMYLQIREVEKTESLTGEKLLEIYKQSISKVDGLTLEKIQKMCRL